MVRVFFILAFIFAAVSKDAYADPMQYHIDDIQPPKNERILTEYEMRAVFIYKIAADHIIWPEGKKKQIKFCTAGEDILFEDKTWQQIAKIAKKKGVTWHTKKYVDYYEVQTCDVVYIYSRSESNIEYYIRAASKANVLTIGESRSFAYHKRGMIELPLTESNTIGLEVNHKRLLGRGFQASQELIEAAELQ